MLTIAELPEFQKQVKVCLEADEQQELIDYLAVNPDSGDLIRGTGGLRKLRWSASGRGKRGGARVIYYYHSEQMPLYLLAIFKKGDKVDLSKTESNELAKLIDLLKARWRL